MDHPYIEEHNVVARYEMGKLSDVERIDFEEHFVDCPECQDQLTMAQDFRQALRKVAAQEGPASIARGQSQPFALPTAWRWGFFGAAAAVVLLVLAGVRLVQERQQLKDELARINNTSQDWQHRYEEEHQANTELQKSLARPGITLPVLASIFPLNATRGGEIGGSEPPNRVVISKSPQWIVLSLDIEEQKFDSYRATLSPAGGQTFWKADDLTPAAPNMLGITIAASSLHEGDYLLTLEGLTRGGKHASVGHYFFRVKFK